MFIISFGRHTRLNKLDEIVFFFFQSDFLVNCYMIFENLCSIAFSVTKKNISQIRFDYFDDWREIATKNIIM